jgi:5-oxoprolinase (ATP-hydrolysing) subunit A
MSARNRIDINSDVGESFGNYRLGMDEEVIPLVSSVNIACGFHAGDPHVMQRTIALAKKHGAGSGAHPGFPDLLGFGRRNLDATLDEIRDYLAYQIGALQAFATRQGVKLQHVKPHGALYNMAFKNLDIWDAVAEVVSQLDKDLILVALAGPDRKKIEAIGSRHGLKTAFEFFADRAYNQDGSLVSRREQGAVIHDREETADRVLRLVKEGKVVARGGATISLAADTICVHGDNPAAIRLIETIRAVLTAAHVEVAPMRTFV